MTDATRCVHVPAGADRDGEERGMGITSLAFKVRADDTGGGLLLIEQACHSPGGPPRHVHLAQEEWFYAVEGEFDVEVGGETLRLSAGDSLLAPRGVPHTWAFIGPEAGRLLVAFTPAGDMEAFFRLVSGRNAMPPQDPELWRRHGMEVVGPPLPPG